MNIFNIHIEFDKNIFNQRIKDCISSNGKGYVCVVDGNVLAQTHKNEVYRQIVNRAFVNTCDGSSIATMANCIYKTRFIAYNGPQVFEHYIECPYKQVLVGNTEEVANEIRKKIIEKGVSNELFHVDLPFCKVEYFDYSVIADQINNLNPDIIWVSLGAPKQEIFMSKILPLINRGVMFGIGAAFNYYIGALELPKNTKHIWVKRISNEPKKQLMRALNYIKVLPSIFISELKNKNQ